MAYQKDPAETKDYAVDWSRHLAEGETVTTSTWTITPSGTGALAQTTPPPTIVGAQTSIRLHLGVAGQEYRVTNHVVTNTGQEFERSFVVNVTDL